MKTIKYIFILVLSACMVALFSCTEDEIVKKGTPGDGHTLRIELTTDANRVVSPLSKASADDPQEKVTDLNILIYDENGTLIENESQYINSGKALSDLSELSTKNDKASTPFTLTDIEPGDKVVYVVANAGESFVNENAVSTEEGLKNYTFGNGDVPRLVMFAEGRSFNVANNPSITSSLKRIYSMVTVKMEFDKNFNKNVQIIPQSVQLKHIPLNGRLSELDGSLENGNKIINGGGSETADGALLGKGKNEDFLLEDHASAMPLFMYENRQPQGKYNDGNYNDERSKTPADFNEATPQAKVIETDKKCSYLEIKAQYIKDGKVQGAGSGYLTYRFFLGTNATDNFDVQRNCHYKVTLMLTGDGGKDEATWRVVADLKKEITIQDVYLGYREGAVSYVQADGDFENAKITSMDNKIDVSIDSNGKVTVRAKETNTHDYSSRSFKYKYTVDGTTKTANVIQVPRLVDPIAIYKKATNDNKTTIRVKAYNPNTKIMSFFNRMDLGLP
ncbi:MAG: hypothetical protein LUH63_06415 [Parabacteroides sp.]|nr:hypothetical protein [Parabacteroides sp.]